jgi:uncharacterized membrane protein YccC
MGKKSIRAIAFILRCSGAATVGYELASSLGLHEALWAAMSAVIVSEEHLQETRSTLVGRVAAHAWSVSSATPKSAPSG